MRPFSLAAGMACISVLIVAAAVVGPRVLPALALSAVPHGFQWTKREDDAEPRQWEVKSAGFTIVREPGQTAPESGAEPACESQDCRGVAGFVRGTMIATPYGAVPIEHLDRGRRIWTRTAAGERVVGRIESMREALAPASLYVVRVQLANGKDIAGTGASRLSDGRTFGSLLVGDRVDGTEVVGAQTLTYPDGRIYEIVPDAETRTYWANGVAVSAD